MKLLQSPDTFIVETLTLHTEARAREHVREPRMMFPKREHGWGLSSRRYLGLLLLATRIVLVFHETESKMRLLAVPAIHPDAPNMKLQ